MLAKTSAKLRDLAEEIRSRVKDENLLDHWHRLSLEWAHEQWKRCEEAQVCEQHLRTEILKWDKQVRDAGFAEWPPKAEYQWITARFEMDAKVDGMTQDTTQLLGAWLAPDVATAPTVQWPLPVPESREPTINEKVVTLLAFAEVASKGGPLLPHSDEPMLQTMFALLKSEVSNLTGDDEPTLRRWLHEAAPAATGDAKTRSASPIGFFGGNELAELLRIPPERRDAFFKQLERLRTTELKEFFLEVSNPKPNSPQFLFRADSKRILKIAEDYTTTSR